MLRIIILVVAILMPESLPPSRIDVRDRSGAAHGDTLPFKERFPPTTIVTFDEGGQISEYHARWRTVAASGGDVEVRGICQSACTLVVIHIPKPRLCFADFSSLGFHQARNDDGSLAPTSTRWIFDRYPADIQAWITARGGWQEMPIPGHGHWVLPAKTLWAMGYRKCDN